ncbi:MAG: DUF11 domain-containing protein [Nitratireductor sp.]|nr:DUF11 domain-containing protein [Nitratireductor sp.]
MTHPWQWQRGTGLARWRRRSPATVLLALLLSLAQVQFALAAIVNTVTVNGTHLGVPLSDTASVAVDVADGVPGMTVVKTGTLNDDDGIAGVSAGDTIGYTVTVENTGTTVLTHVDVDDPLAALSLTGGDANANSVLDPGEVWTYTGSYVLTQADIDSDGGGDGAIENTATVSSDQLPDQDASASVPLNLDPGLEVKKTGVLNDDDGTPGLSAGDTVSYTVTVTNTGNLRLTHVMPDDPLVALTLQSGDVNGDGILDVGEVWTYTGSGIITQGDLDTLGGGDGDLDNRVTVSSDQLGDETADHALPLAPVSSFEVKKTATVPVQRFPTIFEFEYQITVRNTGAVTQTGIRIEDDIAAAIAPATLMAPPVLIASGFAGAGGANAGYDGVTDTQLLTGDVQLAPGGIALITIALTIDTGGNSVSGTNTAIATTDQIALPVASDDPSQTPADPNDVNPTPLDVPDSDGDGGLDTDEDDVGDRDGDGIANRLDYDPTGYFYCETDGRILSGGLITIENLTSGGSQTGIGSSNGISILRDGSDGRYQFFASRNGTYRLTYTLPPTGVASTARLSSGSIDLTSLLPDNPAVFGSGEFGSTGYLADATAGANPFYTVFDIEAGDPAIFNNNIPVKFCGVPSLAVDKSVVSGPTLQPDLTYNVRYRITVTADGEEPVENVQLADDLNAVFGAGNFAVNLVTLESAPAGFAPDPLFDGVAGTAALAAGSTLQPGESVVLLIDVNVSAASGVYENTATARGTSPLDGSAIPPAFDNATVTLANPAGAVTVEKTALPGRAPQGAPVAYTITVRNSGASDLSDIDIVDRIPNGMSYVSGSARVDGIPSEPEQESGAGSGRVLIWRGLSVASGDAVTVTLVMTINASASAEEYVNFAHAEDGPSGAVVSNTAKAKVLLEVEPVFQCSDVIGRVFDDKDRDGYPDDGEPGLPGVRLATPDGVLILTDRFGRYSIACGAIPDRAIGSNFLLKLDAATLPTGYRVTSENPRVVRLTQGKAVKLNFGAANLKLVRLELTDRSFRAGTARPAPETIAELGRMLPLLEGEPSQLRIVYRREGEDAVLARERLEGIETLLRKAWAAKPRPTELLIDKRLIE